MEHRIQWPGKIKTTVITRITYQSSNNFYQAATTNPGQWGEFDFQSCHMLAIQNAQFSIQGY
jgi:hypothetical protein